MHVRVNNRNARNFKAVRTRVQTPLVLCSMKLKEKKKKKNIWKRKDIVKI